MSQDRFVYFSRRGRQPTRDEIQHSMEDYVRGLASQVAWQNGVLYVNLTGVNSTPLRRLETASAAAREQYDHDPDARVIEVWIETEAIDVITRMADEITNRIADGFAKFCRGFWSGMMDIDHDPPCDKNATSLPGLGSRVWIAREDLPIEIRSYRHRYHPEYAAVWDPVHAFGVGSSPAQAMVELQREITTLCERIYTVDPVVLTATSREWQVTLKKAIRRS